MISNERIHQIMDIAEVEVLEVPGISGKWGITLIVELMIRNQHMIYRTSDRMASNNLNALAVLLQDPETRYLVSEILKICNFSISSATTVKQITTLRKKDPDIVLFALRSLLRMEDISEYTSVSSELIYAMGNNGHNQFTQNGTKIRYYDMVLFCGTVLGRTRIEYGTIKTANIINPISAYLDHMGILQQVIQKIRMLKLDSM